MHPQIGIRRTFSQLVSNFTFYISLRIRKLTCSKAFLCHFLLICLLFNLGFNNLYTQHAELMESRRDLLKCQRTEQELIRELDDAHALLSTKEADCTRLAKELGAAQVREAQAEAKCVHEVRKAQQQHELKQATQEHEVSELRLLPSRRHSSVGY